MVDVDEFAKENHVERKKSKDKTLGQVKGEGRGRKEHSEVRNSTRCRKKYL